MPKTPIPEAHKGAIRAFLLSPAGEALKKWGSEPDVDDYNPAKSPTLESAALHGAYCAGFRRVLTLAEFETRSEKKAQPTPTHPGSI